MRREQFRLEQGHLLRFSSSVKGVREFCSTCGAHVLVHGQTEGSSVAVPAGLFVSGTAITVTAHMFVQDKVSWYRITDNLVQYAQWPPGVAFTHTETH